MANSAEQNIGRFGKLMAMTFNPLNIELSTEGFSGRAELTSFVVEKSAKLFRHAHPQVYLARFHIKRLTPRSRGPYFEVRATVEHAGVAHVVHAEELEPEAALHIAIEKLERALTADAGIRKHRQYHTLSVKGNWESEGLG